MEVREIGAKDLGELSRKVKGVDRGCQPEAPSWLSKACLGFVRLSKKLPPGCLSLHWWRIYQEPVGNLLSLHTSGCNCFCREMAPKSHESSSRWKVNPEPSRERDLGEYCCHSQEEEMVCRLRTDSTAQLTVFLMQKGVQVIYKDAWNLTNWHTFRFEQMKAGGRSENGGRNRTKHVCHNHLTLSMGEPRPELSTAEFTLPTG